MADDTTSIRPYFVPKDLDFDQLPAGVRTAVEAIVEPAYRELVLEAPDALSRATGATVTHLLFLEIVEQFELGRQISANLQNGSSQTSPREQDLRRHLRLLGAKERNSTFLQRLNEFRNRRDPFQWLAQQSLSSITPPSDADRETETTPLGVA